MTPSEAAKLVTVALAAYPTPASFLGPDAVEGMATAWAMVLADLEYAEGSAALARYMATTPDKLPSPGHIRRICDEARHGRTRAGSDAWEDVRREIGATGRYREPRFADPITAAVVRGLGWRELCDSENAVADRARFIDAYEVKASHAAQDRSVATLPGVARPALPGKVGALVGDVTKRLTEGRP